MSRLREYAVPLSVGGIVLLAGFVAVLALANPGEDGKPAQAPTPAPADASTPNPATAPTPVPPTPPPPAPTPAASIPHGQFADPAPEPVVRAPVDLPPETPEQTVELISDWRSVVLHPNPRILDQFRRRLLSSGEEGVTALRYVAEHDADPRVRAHATSILALMNRADLADFFRARLGDASELVRESAVVGVSRLGLTEEVRRIADTDPSDRVRRHAASLLQ